MTPDDNHRAATSRAEAPQGAPAAAARESIGGADNVLLTRSQIHEIIPHGDAFMFLDCVTSFEPGKRVVGRLADLTKEPHRQWMEAHFPGNPIVPGAIIMEALAQIGAIALNSMPENRNRLVMLAGVKRWRFRRSAIPGHPVRLEAELTRMRGPFGQGHVQAFDEHGNVLAEGDLQFAMAERGSLVGVGD